MLSIIICSINPEKFELVSKNYAELLGDAPFEIIGIHDAQSLCEGYNRGIIQSRGDILIFCHDDIEIISPDFYPRLRQYLQVYDVVGCAGTSHLVASNWGYAGDPYLHGTVAYPVTGNEWPGNRFDLSVWGEINSVVVEGIQALDGFFFAVTRRVVNEIRFDEQNFDGFHIYDTDFTFAAYLAGFKLAVCNDILIAHQSRGNYCEKYAAFSARFMEKYQGRLPVQECNNRQVALAKNLDRAQMLRIGGSFRVDRS